jgi:hypothetical protein
MSHRCLREEKNGEWETRRNGTPTGYANGRWGGAEGWGMNLMCAWVHGCKENGWGTWMDGLLRTAGMVLVSLSTVRRERLICSRVCRY